MDPADAIDLLTRAVPRGAAVWADLGAGDGTFTHALAALLGPGSRIYAVDRDERALARLGRKVPHDRVTVVPVNADFTRQLDVASEPLDGLLFANALHFVASPEALLASWGARLRPGGRIVIVEYDRRGASRWVPFPIPSTRIPALATAAGLGKPAIVATRPSAFGGMLYVAVANRLPEVASLDR